MSALTISQAAKALGVNKRTLIRWDNPNQFPSQREPHSGNRYYDEQDVRNHALWFGIRKKHKQHVRKLDAIRKEVDKYIVTQPLGPFHQPKFHKYEDMKKAFDDLRVWENEHEKILGEYSKLPRGFKAKIDPDF